LGAIADTDTAPQASNYDALRALPPGALAARVRASAADYAAGLPVLSDRGPVALTVVDVAVDDPGDIRLTRATRVTLAGNLPPGATALRIAQPAAQGALALRQTGVEAPFTAYLAAGEVSPAIPLAGGGERSALGTLVDYIAVGFVHIIPRGLDHILFVLALFFLVPRLKPLVLQVSAFTLAHTVTLGLGAAGWISLPAAVVEPVIAASIVVIAVENILRGRMTAWRPFSIFAFGLLHGLGFAGVLAEFGLPEAGFVAALIGFNIGVELGQLTVIALAFALVGVWFGARPWYRRAIAVPASCAIALVGAHWFVDRIWG
ncbi:MAG TPA: HupE/UreJ family protein, partial [Paracoccaceae bacterium]|nr:HupE/UreJ family protein [Paracoccaceae bacterium]